MLHRSIASLACTLVLAASSFAQGASLSPARLRPQQRLTQRPSPSPSTTALPRCAAARSWAKLFLTTRSGAQAPTTPPASPQTSLSRLAGPRFPQAPTRSTRSRLHALATHHQQADRTVGNRVPPGTGSRPYPHEDRKTLSSPQEKMSITFENTTRQLHRAAHQVGEHSTSTSRSMAQ